MRNILASVNVVRLLIYEVSKKFSFLVYIYCTTSWKVAGLIPSGVFFLHNLSGCSMAMG